MQRRTNWDDLFCGIDEIVHRYTEKQLARAGLNRQRAIYFYIKTRQLIQVVPRVSLRRYNFRPFSVDVAGTLWQVRKQDAGQCQSYVLFVEEFTKNRPPKIVWQHTAKEMFRRLNEVEPRINTNDGNEYVWCNDFGFSIVEDGTNVIQLRR